MKARIKPKRRHSSSPKFNNHPKDRRSSGATRRYRILDDDTLNTVADGIYDTTTVGVPSAHCIGFKNGGDYFLLLMLCTYNGNKKPIHKNQIHVGIYHLIEEKRKLYRKIMKKEDLVDAG